jgi:hypothetical protein
VRSHSVYDGSSDPRQAEARWTYMRKASACIQYREERSLIRPADFFNWAAGSGGVP